MFVWVVTDMLGTGKTGLILYTIISLLMAVFATALVEEPFLELRKKVIPVLFKRPAPRITPQPS
jgi:peptidoglycan/LPS O-acetylase OafA/YrhL